MTILVTDRDHAELQRLAKGRGITMSRLIREAVEAYEAEENPNA